MTAVTPYSRSLCLLLMAFYFISSHFLVQFLNNIHYVRRGEWNSLWDWLFFVLFDQPRLNHYPCFMFHVFPTNVSLKMALNTNL